MKSAGTAIGLVILAVVLMVALSVGAMYASGLLQMGTSDFRGEVEERERVNADGDYRIANYDYFFKTCNAIQAKNDKIEILRQQMKATDDPATKAGYEQGLTAEMATKAELVADYNAKAAQSDTRGQYRDAGLPYEISNDDMEVSCDPA